MHWHEIEQAIDHGAGPQELLTAAESVLENWVASQQLEPTAKKKEGFRLLALHAQGAKGEPSFNACRETCREACFHYNLLLDEALDQTARDKTLLMMRLVVRHLMLFIHGKMEVAGLGEFCCSAKPIRAKEAMTIANEMRS